MSLSLSMLIPIIIFVGGIALAIKLTNVALADLNDRK